MVEKAVRYPGENGEVAGPRRPGIGVDAAGGEVIDPTKNVLDLVRAESKYQDGMREALSEYLTSSDKKLSEFQNYARGAESRLQTMQTQAHADTNRALISSALAELRAETKRLDELAEQRKTYESTIASMLAESVKSTSALVSTQLVQIQSTFDARVNKLEEFRLLSTGRSSVSDPAQQARDAAITESMNKMASAIAMLDTSKTAVSSEKQGQGQTWAFIAIGISALSAMAIIFDIVSHIHP